MSHARHCQIAELAAVITMCGGVSISAGDYLTLKIKTENKYVIRKTAALIDRLFRIRCELSVQKRRHRSTYLALVPCHTDAVRILQTLHLMQDGILTIEDTIGSADSLIIQRSCCRRAFIRGAFLTSGSVSDPSSDYHMELTVQMEEKAKQLQDVIASLGIDAHITRRRQSYVVYLKEGDQISDLLGMMEAPKAMLAMENIRIYKSIGNSVNRQVNCETANLHKTIAAAVSSIEDIEYLQQNGVFAQLDPGLQETALLRLSHPDASLAVLGSLHDKPVGKSGVNHRLKKISSIAADLRIRS